tara:strand:- start:93 stop:251 length:159 start_codon:yes stop_codon:yes gene_type:complete
MTHHEIQARLESIEEKAKKACEEAAICKEAIKKIMSQNAQYKEKLIECGYLV